jgi:uncharacterized protein (DUF433 family)
MSAEYRTIISINPAIRGGQACIRDTRINVRDVLEYLAGGMSVAQVLQDFPELTENDIRAVFAYAADFERGIFWPAA